MPSSNIKVRKKVSRKTNSTDINLLVNTETDDVYYEWDRNKISTVLREEGGVGERTAKNIAKTVEERVMSSGIEKITTSLIRELVDNELFELGYQKKLEKQTSIGLPKSDIEELIFSKSKENSNIGTNNPEAIQHSLSETILKQYALQEVFSKEVTEAHKTGMVHLHDLGYPTRLYCSSHSLEYIKKYGLDLDNLDSISAPAKHARTLSVHLNSFLSSMQAYYAGALGVAYVNIMYAPYVEHMTDDEMYQEAQHLIFQASQNAFTRGGQTLFIDFNIHTGVPGYLKNIKAIGPGGKYTGKCYSEYEDVARRFTHALLRVWGKGDANGTPMAFPKLDFHINEETFSDPKQKEVFDYACKITAKNGIVYFIFDRDEVTLSACCRLRTAIDDNYMIDHPESMRFSFPGNEMLLVKYKNNIKSISFEKLYDIVDEDVVNEDEFEIKYTNNLEVWDQNGWTNVQRVLRHKKGNKNFCAIRTKGGKTIITTEDHPIINQIISNKPERCYHCDYQHYQEYGNTKYGKKLFRCKSCHKYFVSDQYVYEDNKLLNAMDISRNNLLISSLEMPDFKKKNLDEQEKLFNGGLGYVLGCYIGDGYYNKHNNKFQISVCSDDRYHIIENVSRILLSYCCNSKVYPDRNNKRLIFKHDALCKYINNTNVIGLSHIKQLPDCIFQMKDGYVCDIISGIIDTDGYVSGKNICIGINSKVALTQIQNWLEWKGHRSFLYTTESKVKCKYIYNGEEKPCRPSYVLEVPLTTTVKHMLNMSTKVSTMEEHEVDFFDNGDNRIKCNIIFDSPKDEYVYDITTDTSTFVANGIVLHNCGFQNVTINLPQCAYRAGKNNTKEFYKELESVFDICIQAHLDKKKFSSQLMSKPGMPLWQMGKIARDGRPYVDLEKATYIVGVIGLNECLDYLTGKELHTDESTLWDGIRIISYLYFLAKEAESKYGLKFSIEESPAESASRRLAKIDLYNYKDEAIVRGEGDQIYYSNSIHMRPDANIDLLTRITWQAKFHKVIESGAIIHAFVGEKMPSPKSIANVIYKAFKNTDAAQMTISPEFTICRSCGKTKMGLSDSCQCCGAANIYGIEFGKFTEVVEWNSDLLEK